MRMPKKNLRKTDGVIRRDALYAPWRHKYLKAGKRPDCFFCEAAAAERDDVARWKEILLVHRDQHNLLILNRYPYIGGHLLVAPLQHTHDLAALKPAANAGLWELTHRALGALQSIYEPHGANIGMNLGKAGGAAVEAHLHMHIVPRWLGDTNYMFVTADTHMVHGDLEELWAALRRKFGHPVE